MVRRLIFLLVIIACTISSNLRAQDVPVSVKDSSFNYALKYVMGSAKKSFANIKGPVRMENVKNFGKSPIYSTSALMPGAKDAAISSGLTFTYQCLLDTGRTAADLVFKYLQLSQKVAACFDSAYKYQDIADSAGTNINTFQAQPNIGTNDDLYEPNVIIKLEKKGRDKFILLLEVSEPFFKRKP